MKNVWSFRPLATALLLGTLVFVASESILRAQTTESATQSLLDRAQTLEARGRIDLAAQDWQQVLLVDPKNVNALAGLSRSASLSGNPALANTYHDRIRAINPNAPELGQAYRNQPKPSPLRTSQVPPLEAAYSALNAKDLPEAERRFQSMLAKDPQNTSALAGMGYVRMQQSNFAGAISFLEQAKQNGAHDAGLDSALKTAHFYLLMGQGMTALNQNDLTTAEQRYRAALAMRPASPEALEGLGGTLLKAQQPGAAIEVFERDLQVQPSSPAAWRGLFMAQLGAGNVSQALLTERSVPPAVRAQLMRDPVFLRSLASAYTSVGRDTDAQRALQTALDLPVPSGAQDHQVETQLQYASLLQQANRLEQAAALYKQVLAVDAGNVTAWQGLVRIQHAMKEDPQALQTLQAMPRSTYDAAMRDPGFQITVASVYQGENKLDIAQDILEKSVAQQTAAGKTPSAAVSLALAGIYLSRNDPQRALPIYRAVLSENSDRPDAWKGLLYALHTTGHDREALAQVQQIPPPVRQQLENDVEYLETVGAIYNSLGQPREAMVFMNRVKHHYAVERTAAPAEIDIQDAWLLFNSGNDAGLYRQLMLLGGREDLNDEQRRSVQMIWTNWAVRRANQAAASGDLKRSLAILNAAALSFPDNPAVLRALASGYARAGLPKQAVLIFKSQDMTTATASDYKAAVGAALAAGDMKIAETWLRYGFDKYPKDSEILALAAKFEQARGNTNRAADYYRASLAALPPRDPAAELAAELSQPQAMASLPNPSHPKDLASLLSTPDSTAPVQPYLPSYNNADTAAQAEDNSNIVPSYMANPANRTTQPTASGQTIASNTPPPAGPPTQQEVFGPYVPYVPPTQTVATQSPEASSVQPSARYIPNTEAAHIKSSHTSGSHQQVPQPASYNYGQQYPQPRTMPRTGPSQHISQAPVPEPASVPVPAPITTRPSASTPPSAPPASTLPPLNYPNAAPGQPLTDADLVARSVPPLRGSYGPNAPAALGPPLTQRQKTELDLAALEASFSGWIGATGFARYRNGTPGFDRLTDVQSPFEASAVLGKTLRATVVAQPVFLNSGTIDTASFQNSTSTVPVLGTLPANAPVTPPQQFANGLGGELHLTSTNLGLALGYTPYEFLVANITGRAQWRPLGGPVTFFGDRDSVKDTQLSYAGLRDPGSATPSFAGNIWGGVISTGGGIRLNVSGAKSGLYVSGDGANLTGFHVLANQKYEGLMGAYFQVKHWPGYGALNIGANFFGMHYQFNERGMTYGQGGYFSPNVFFLAAVPITYSGHYKTAFHYTVSGSIGLQSFQESAAPYYPIDPVLQAASGNAQTPASSNTGVNYSFNGEGAYRAADHWYFGAFLSANNTNNYNMVSGGFFVRYLFKLQYPTEDYPTGLFQTSGLRALRVP
jgi:cellulose synthase operon protein C